MLRVSGAATQVWVPQQADGRADMEPGAREAGASQGEARRRADVTYLRVFLLLLFLIALVLVDLKARMLGHRPCLGCWRP